MTAFQVNRRVALALALSVACAPTGNKSSETAATRTDTAHVAAAPPDSNITRADLARIQGSSNAPIWVIEVSDFQCPFCKEWHDQTYRPVLDQYVKTGKVRLAYVNFPLAIHANAWPAAEAAMCAGAQNKFWVMHDSLFASQARWETLRDATTAFDSLAKSTGIDMTKWRDCVKSGKMKALIQADHDRAQQAGARATPSFMIGDKLLTGAQPLTDLQRVIDSALVKTKNTVQ
jgi:protein-disulfide isomerase